jgi:hypothetical protein
MLAKNMGFKFNYIEHGWFPQKDYYYIDPEGVNARSSIAKNAPPQINKAQKDKLKKWLFNYTKKYHHIAEKPKQILVPLQVDTDTNITLHSPFKSMKEFINYLEKEIPDDYNVILRPHPLGEYDYPITSSKNNFTVDSGSNLNQLVAESKYIIGINSTVLLEGLCFKKDVIPLGYGILSKKSEIRIPTTENKEIFLPLLYSLQYTHQIPMPKGISETIIPTLNDINRRRIPLSLFSPLKYLLYYSIRKLINKKFGIISSR